MEQKGNQVNLTRSEVAGAIEGNLPFFNMLVAMAIARIGDGATGNQEFIFPGAQEAGKFVQGVQAATNLPKK